MKYYLAIDIGASSGRHIISYVKEGKIYTEEIYRFQNGPSQKGDSLYWDTERLYTEILAGLKKAKEVNKVPAYVGIDTWGVDYVLLGGDGKALSEAFCYRDNRTKDAIEEVHKILPFSELYHKTGIQFQPFNTIYQLYDDKINGRLENAEYILALPDYFHYRLTGVMLHEYTHSTTTGMVNAKTHTWDEEIIEKLGLKKSLFTAISQPGTIVGDFSKEVAEYVGYTATVVLPATHDTASAVLAAPLKGRTPYISSGTWSLLGVEQDHAYTTDFALEKDYSNEGSINYDFRLQKNIMGLWMIQQVRHETGDKYDFATLAKLASETPVDDRVKVNDERFLAPKNMTQEIENAVGRKLTIGELAHIIFTSLAESYAESLKALEELTGETYSTLNIIGGGSKNTFLNELTKKATGKEIIAGPAEGTAIGNILMQMVGTGEIKSVKEGREMIVNSFDIIEV